MADVKILNKDEIECLEEIVNISFGSAASVIADLFESFATLSIPSLEVVDSQNLNDHISKYYVEKEDIYLATQAFKGAFEGETIFFIDDESALNLVKLLFEINEVNRRPIDIEQNDINSAILEISNIVSSSCISKIGELLNTSILFSAPVIELSENQHLLFDNQSLDCEQVIVIETTLKFKDKNISAYLAILPSNYSFGWLQKALQEFLESYGV